MDVIIGLGSAGCRIAATFSKYPQYKVYMLDSEQREQIESSPSFAPEVFLIDERGETSNYHKLSEQTRIEDYERTVPDLKNFFKDLSGTERDVLFVVAGAGTISGASLAILEQIKKHRISILYIRPDLSVLNDSQKKQDKVIFKILQEYTRSAVFERMYICDNACIENILGDVPIISLYDMINQTIVTTMHMLNVFEHTEAVIATKYDKDPSARLSTIGVVDLEKSEEKLFFPLDKPREKIYIYGVNEERLSSEGGLHKKIKNQVKNYKDNDIVKISYSIHATKYEEDIGYCIHNTALIQD